MDDKKKMKVTTAQRYRAVDDLIEDSRTTETYMILLVISSVIIAAGSLLANESILIGGMLVTPVLTPVLLLALGISIGRIETIKFASKTLLKSFGILFVITLIISVLIGLTETATSQGYIFENSVRTGVLYFMVAIASGCAASYAWIHKNISNILPGISIAVALVPPFAQIAVWLTHITTDATLAIQNSRFYLLVFLFNVIGIVLGAIVVFSLTRMYKTERQVVKKVEEIVEEEEKEREAKEKAKEAEKKA